MAREFRVRNMVRLRESPHADAPSPLGTVSPDDVVTILSEQGEWSEVRVVDEAGNVRTGFVRMSMLEERPPLAPSEEEAIDEANFALALTFAARTHGVNRDYLIAVAWVESRIKNVTNETTGAIGPFQFMPSTWGGPSRPTWSTGGHCRERHRQGGQASCVRGHSYSGSARSALGQA